MEGCSKVLVAGGAGFIGSHLVDCLMGRGCFVRVVTRAETKRVKLIRHQSRTLNEEMYEGGAS